MKNFVNFSSKNLRNKLGDTLVVNEPPVKAEELLEEIKPLFDDYFVGEISFDGESLFYLLPNGQKFKLKIEEKTA
ncbi:MAG: hypothetical protein K2K80_06240 [Clostridia bacterium]|nr:hypothetical protein [Clostridia bacterium]